MPDGTPGSHDCSITRAIEITERTHMGIAHHLEPVWLVKCCEFKEFTNYLEPRYTVLGMKHFTTLLKQKDALDNTKLITNYQTQIVYL